MAFLEEDTFDVVANTREEYREWRRSSTPVFDAVHAVLEVALVLGWMFRYLCHFWGHATYLQGRDGEPPEYHDEDFRFTALVAPILQPENWRQEALMRGMAAAIGLVLLTFGINPMVTLTTDMAMVRLRYWVALSQGGYLVLDPVLGAAWHIARGEP